VANEANVRNTTCWKPKTYC